MEAWPALPSATPVCSALRASDMLLQLLLLLLLIVHLIVQACSYVAHTTHRPTPACCGDTRHQLPVQPARALCLQHAAFQQRSALVALVALLPLRHVWLLKQSCIGKASWPPGGCT